MTHRLNVPPPKLGHSLEGGKDAPKVTCFTCPWWREDRVRLVVTQTSVNSASIVPLLCDGLTQCHYEPEPRLKDKDDFCHHHPGFNTTSRAPLTPRVGDW